MTFARPEPGVVIIFGAAVRADGTPSGALADRVRAAARFGVTVPEVRYMPTGGQGRHGPPEWEVMTRLLIEHGVRRVQIEPEMTGRNTLGSVRACARKLPAGCRVYAATSAYHLPRCLVLLRLAGFEALACPPPHGPASARASRRWFWRLREVVALPVDAALMVGWRVRGR